MKYNKVLIKALKFLPIEFIFKPFFSGKGTILFMHKIVSNNNTGRRVALMKANELDIGFLEKMILALKKRNFDFISLDEMYNRLGENHDKKFIVLTFDDGYKDNYTLAYPLLKKLKIPFAIYITNCYPNHTAKMWWYMIEDIILENDIVEISLGKEKILFSTKTQKDKDSAFVKIRKQIIDASKDLQLEILNNLEDQYKKNLRSYVEREALNWNEITDLASDELVTIGCHSQNHYSFNTLSEDEILEEINSSKKEIENHLKKNVRHFAYPYGTKNEIGKREIEIVKNSHLFDTATTARTGNIFEVHKNELHTLPRVQITGDQEDISIINLYLSGVLPAVKNKFKRVITV